MKCCARCKTPGYGCANGNCQCHVDAMEALALASPDVPPSLPKSADSQTGGE